MLQACAAKSATDFQTALEQACEAFPIVAFLHTLEDNKRRIMAISECIVDSGQISYLPLWRYEIRENYRRDDGTVLIRGSHCQLNNFSPSMLERMKMYGISQKEINEIQIQSQEEVEVCNY